jgi:hypothetical protein
MYTLTKGFVFIVSLLMGILIISIAKGDKMAKVKQPAKQKVLPKIDPQPVQMKFLKAEESIVFFGGGAK